jgi:hypothetical protein
VWLAVVFRLRFALLSAGVRCSLFSVSFRCWCQFSVKRFVLFVVLGTEFIPGFSILYLLDCIYPLLLNE